jgi:hypothetical protein
MSSTVAPKAPSPGKHEHLFEATGVLPRHTLMCHFDLDPGEPQTRWEPGYPASLEMVACYLYDADILELMDQEVLSRIEAAAAEYFNRQSSENEVEEQLERFRATQEEL